MQRGPRSMMWVWHDRPVQSMIISQYCLIMPMKAETLAEDGRGWQAGITSALVRHASADQSPRYGVLTWSRRGCSGCTGCPWIQPPIQSRLHCRSSGRQPLICSGSFRHIWQGSCACSRGHRQLRTTAMLAHFPAACLAAMAAIQ